MTNSALPILSVKDLKTYYFQDEGVVRAVDGASFDVYSGRTLGIVGESGCGKSVTARSILRIVEETGEITEGEILLRQSHGNGQVDEIDLTKLDANGRKMRAIRGGEIALIFQEPMTSFSSFHTVGNQIVEAIRLHSDMDKKQAREHGIEMLRMVGIPKPERRFDEYSFQLSGGLIIVALVEIEQADDIFDQPRGAAGNRFAQLQRAPTANLDLVPGRNLAQSNLGLCRLGKGEGGHKGVVP